MQATTGATEVHLTAPAVSQASDRLNTLKTSVYEALTKTKSAEEFNDVFEVIWDDFVRSCKS